MRRLGLLVITCLLVMSCALLARPRIRSIAVDDRGQARLHVTQRQIFDEVGGKADLRLDFPGGLGVFKSDLELPEEAGEISGQAYVAMTPGALSTVGDFSYKPLTSKQVKLEMDYRSVENEKNASGVNNFSLNYPLSLENVEYKMAQYLAKTSYSIVGKGKWSRYTQADGSLKIQIQDPDLRHQKTDVNLLGLRLVNHGAITNISLHFDVVRGSPTAQIFQSAQSLEMGLNYIFTSIGLSVREVRVTKIQVKGGSVQADVQISLFNVRQKLDDLAVFVLREVHIKGVRNQDIAAAISTMIQVEFSNLDMLIQRRADHFDVDINVNARQVDRCIVGYLRLREVLEPAAVEAGTQNRGLSALVKNVNAVKTKRFRNLVIAAANSTDGGTMDYSLKVRFPKGRVDIQASTSSTSVREAHTFADKMMKLPSVPQAYSLLKVHTAPGGLQGHFLHEAQGPWFESQWSLWSEAARGNKEVQPYFPLQSKPALEEGRLLLALDKSRVNGIGWLKFVRLGAYAMSLMATEAKIKDVTPLALDVRYDADEEPGRIVADMFVRAPSAAALQQALGQGVKRERLAAVDPPAVSRPSVEIPAGLAAAIEADRKTLGVTPWTAPRPPAALAPPSIELRGIALVVGSCILLVVALSAGVYFWQKRQSELEAVPVAYVAPDASPLLSAPGPTLRLPQGAFGPPVGAPEPGPPPLRPQSPQAADEAFRDMMLDRIRAAWPDSKVSVKDRLELTVVKDGVPQTLDLEQLYFMLNKPGVDREKAIQNFVARLPT